MEGRTDRGRPRETWDKAIAKYLQRRQVTVKQAKEMAQDRKLWKKFTNTGIDIDNNDDETDDPKEIHEAGRTDEEGEEERVEAVIVQNESAIAQSDPEEMPQNEPEPSPEKPAEEKFVIVQYSGKLYPGLVMSNDEKHEETEISAMKKRGKFWTWPNPPDVVWYRKNQIKGPLNPPQKIGDNLYQTNLKS
ncbi:hypothetical protein QE152_g25540 [Popillia japonica]|uniref:Uncharacterized protein n=1 Tax=Popillia japonica TaxID=7064 RepID=A0AAW1K1I0_POPJA